MLPSYKMAKSNAQAEIIEKKSRFISHVAPVTSEQEAIDFISLLRSKYWDASHNVYAYILRDNNIQRYSDDGEPSGTAGVPVLEVIRKEGLVNTIVVVTRYFGGTLLGAGGLVRAYTKSAKAGIDASGRITMQMCAVYRIIADYDLLGRLQNAIYEKNAIINDTAYKENVAIEVFVPDEDGFKPTIIDVSNGRATISRVDERYVLLEER